MPRRLSRQVFGLVTAFGLCAGAPAAELGDPRVVSHIGQQLIADIELAAIEDPGAAVQVRLASADVYRGASIDLPSVLASLNMNVMRRDGKQFLHVTSLKPVETDHLHLFLELNDGARRSVRLATLWLTPEPTPPAPPAAHAPVAAAAGQAAPPWAWKAPVSRQASAPLAKAVAAPACKPQPAPQAQPDPVCSALDHKNADLRAQVSRLEEKVKLLQAEAKRKPVAIPVKAPAPLVKARPVPQGRPRVAPPPVGAPRAQAQAWPAVLPWGWIAGAGAVVFMLIGAVRFARMKRAQAQSRLKARATRESPVLAEPTLG
jgi:hypothetical protein